MSNKKSKDDGKRRTGPEPDRLKLDGNWEETAGKAIKKPKPKEGWPKKPDRNKEGQPE